MDITREDFDRLEGKIDKLLLAVKAAPSLVPRIDTSAQRRDDIAAFVARAEKKRLKSQSNEA